MRILLGLLLVLLAVGSVRAQGAADHVVREKGWGTLDGALAWVEPSFSAQLQDKQLVLVDESGGMTVLIGEQMNKLLDSAGKRVIVTGVYKPAMVIKGKRTAVLEVRSIDEKKP